ncbi:hypothetical protein [Motilibacter aurantiacus]|uniref:hypothetical protein n=1 Tax=Motilibacter aurantiacus TaxID=2714955 RepID=UPI00140E249C|nr:hypothetical protein [Motilibacter aurantiacus]NHC44595.1 hypothetical protein [Motilibacter aurantiacus]
MAWLFLALTVLWLAATVVLVRRLELSPGAQAGAIAAAGVGCLGGLILVVDSLA